MKNLNEMTSKELKEMAKELKVKNWWNLNKAQLISGIQGVKKVAVVQLPKLTLDVLLLPAPKLVYGGKKGITNFQMIPAIKQNISDTNALIELYKINPDVFKSSVKYLPDNMKLIGKEIVNHFDPTFTVKTGKKIVSVIVKEAV